MRGRRGFLAQTAGDAETSGLPAFVKREFEAYLRRGILGHLVRVRCDTCAEELVVAFSCSELAAHLVDRVLPHVPVRQWVFTVPVPVRDQLAFGTPTVYGRNPVAAVLLGPHARRRSRLCASTAATMVTATSTIRAHARGSIGTTRRTNWVAGT